MEKTNAARILDRMKIKYELKEYDFDPDNLEAGKVAEKIGEDTDAVYKTIVLKGETTGCIVAVIDAGNEVNLKKLAKVSGNKKVEPLPLKELQPTTGYIRGGCTALGMKKKFPTFLSIKACSRDYIYISAGKRGLQIKLNPMDFLAATDGMTADIGNN